MKKRLAAIASLLLATVLLLASCGLGEKSSAEEAAAKPGSQETETEPTISIKISDLKRYLDSSSSMMELAQRFFTDTIVYRGADGKYKFEPVNDSLPLSNYDWDGLRPGSGKELILEREGEPASIKGIDVSRYQGDVDWEKVAADGVKFVFVRLGYRGYSEGALITDEKFEEYVKGAAQHGIGVGIYFVTQAITEEEAIEEAEFVLDSIRPYNITWPVVLDIEEAASITARTVGLGAKDRTDQTIAFCEKIREAGYTPMLYCNIRWYLEELELERLTAYDKWFAQYFNRPFFPYEFTVWQYTNTGRVDGIKGDVDLNISMKDYSKKD
ncbi:MAG: glycoside hydrolase family 25 protein [Firmicutes bacterium]|nr:glycoside hydrolase family 25 protein [Bacillota bacterium]